MSVLEIVKHPDPLLREKSETIEQFDEELKTFVQNMAETMRDAKGIGLAAVQVGELKRVLVLEVNHIGQEGEDDEELEPELEVYVNPEILEESGDTEYEEGCLSIPGVTGKVARSAELKLRFQDLEGKIHEIEADGLRAIALQHEIDHLNGVLFLDHLGAMTRTMLLSKYNKLQQQQRNA